MTARYRAARQDARQAFDVENLRFIDWLATERRHVRMVEGEPDSEAIGAAVAFGLAALYQSPCPEWARSGAYKLVALTERGRQAMMRKGEGITL